MHTAKTILNFRHRVRGIVKCEGNLVLRLQHHITS